MDWICFEEKEEKVMRGGVNRDSADEKTPKTHRSCMKRRRHGLCWDDAAKSWKRKP